MSDEGLNPLSCPDTVSFTSVIQAWSRSSSKEAAEKAEALLFECRERSTEKNSVAPDIVMYNMVLHAWAGHNKRERDELRSERVDETGARRAESLLLRMKESGEISPDVVSYNIVMNAWSNSGNYIAAARRARDILEELKARHRAGDEKSEPDVITYNTAIKLIARSRVQGCFDEAKALMEEMQEVGHKINAVTCNTVLAALVKSGEPDAVKIAESMINDMESMYKEGNKNVRPGEVTFNILLHAYAKSKDPDDSIKAEKLLDRMVETLGQDGRQGSGPSVKSFATLLDLYARTGQSEAAELLFDKMARSGKVQFNTISYNTVLNALSKSNDKDAPYRAEALLKRMQQEYEAGNEDVKPNTISFSSLLNIWAKSDWDFAAERAEAILTRMEDLAAHGSSHVAPTVVSYGTALHAWSRSNAPDSAERAVAILTRMEDAFRTGHHFSKPNAYCYNAAMNAVAKSATPDKASKSYELLHRMIRAYKAGNDSARPSATSFSTVLNACAYTNGTPELQKEAFRIARTTFAELIESEYGEPNVITYVNFMTACSRLLPEGAVRDNMMGAVFHECNQNGLVNGKVVSILRRSLAPEAFHEYMTSIKRL